MSSQGVSHSNLTAMGTLAPATTPAFSQNNMDAYTGFLFPQPVSMRQLVDILSNFLSCYAAGLLHLKHAL